MRAPSWRGLPFERKLLITFLVLALAPTLFLMMIQIARLERTINLWETPNVDGALESSVAFVQRITEEEDARRDHVGGATLRLLTGLVEGPAPFDGEEAVRLVHAQFGADGPVGIRLVLDREGSDTAELMVWGKSVAGKNTAGESVAGKNTAGESVAVKNTVGKNTAVSAHATTLAGGAKLTAFLTFDQDARLAEERKKIEEGYRFYRRLGVYERLEQGKIWIQTIAILFAAALLALVVARLLSRSLSRPISSLVEGTSRVRAGDLDVRIEPESVDELGQLVQSFNDMTRDLKESREKLVRAERIAAWAEAARRIAHEIKNPLTPITLSLHRLGKRVASLPEEDRAVVMECLESILEEVEALKSFAGEFSQFSRLPSPKMAPFDINDLLRSVGPLYIEGRDVEIDWRLTPGSREAHGDRELLRRVFSNLVKNAVEAMDGKGTIIIGSRENAGGGVEVTIGDSGPGISAADRSRVFNPYFTTRSDGTGLGLALVDRIVHEHGGSISIGESPLGGALFRIVLSGLSPLPSGPGESRIDRESNEED